MRSLTACSRRGTAVHLYPPPMCEFIHPRKSVCAAVCDSLSAAQQVCTALSTRRDERHTDTHSNSTSERTQSQSEDLTLTFDLNPKVTLK